MPIFLKCYVGTEAQVRRFLARDNAVAALGGQGAAAALALASAVAPPAHEAVLQGIAADPFAQAAVLAAHGGGGSGSGSGEAPLTPQALAAAAGAGAQAAAAAAEAALPQEEVRRYLLGCTVLRGILREVGTPPHAALAPGRFVWWLANALPVGDGLKYKWLGQGSCRERVQSMAGSIRQSVIMSPRGLVDIIGSQVTQGSSCGVQ